LEFLNKNGVLVTE